MHSRKKKQGEKEEKCVCFMLYVILILSIDVMNVENIIVDIIPRARFFSFDVKFTFVRGLFLSFGFLFSSAHFLRLC